MKPTKESVSAALNRNQAQRSVVVADDYCNVRNYFISQLFIFHQYSYRLSLIHNLSPIALMIVNSFDGPS